MATAKSGADTAARSQRLGSTQTKASRAAKQKSKSTAPTLKFEQFGFDAGHKIIAGIDEAGRGPWAGPVVAAAVILDTENIPDGIADSKKLTEARREALFEDILRSAEVGVGFADPERIDRDNILAATMWSMQRAAADLKRRPELLLIDGNRAPEFDCAVQTIVKGDALSLSIAAASIVAKVTRDRIMKRFDAQYPGYGFERHKGYGTAAHSEALRRLGVTPLHRRSFKPVQAAISGNWQALNRSTSGRSQDEDP